MDKTTKTWHLRSQSDRERSRESARNNINPINVDEDALYARYQHGYTVKHLRTELKRRSLPSSGLKADLIKRLVESDKCEINGELINSGESSRSPNKSDAVNGGRNIAESSPSYHQNPSVKRKRKMERELRQNIVLWKQPLKTLNYFVLELILTIQVYLQSILRHRKTCMFIILLSTGLLLAYTLPGNHQQMVQEAEELVFWCCYWIGLGILSSVGLGTGLHTFLLYLGPHIAQVTLAAWECKSLNFPEPPYPNDILCPVDGTTSKVSLLTIMSKVRLEAFMWGAGTAIGELPPYFMARAARLSGVEFDDEDLEEVEQLEEMKTNGDLDIWTKLKKSILDFVKRMGFFGILVCASIPNPLFDLAGITCGHCLIPFWTFFGATLIGKAIIKMHLQKTFVILSFSKTYVETVLQLAGDIPIVGPYLKSPFQKALEAQKNSLHRKPGQPMDVKKTNPLAWIFEKVVMFMILYFVLSIINSMAQSYDKRLREGEKMAPRSEVKVQ